MHRDVFGNLREWGRVLERLEALTRSEELDAHQDALVTLLRYRGNWRLREAALEAAASVRCPGEPLVRQVCRIMMDEGLYYQVRVLAAEALGACLERIAESSDTPCVRIRREARERMHALLDAQDVPVLHQAVRRMLPNVE